MFFDVMNIDRFRHTIRYNRSANDPLGLASTTPLNTERFSLTQYFYIVFFTLFVVSKKDHINTH